MAHLSQVAAVVLLRQNSMSLLFDQFDNTKLIVTIVSQAHTMRFPSVPTKTGLLFFMILIQLTRQLMTQVMHVSYS